MKFQHRSNVQRDKELEKKQKLKEEKRQKEKREKQKRQIKRENPFPTDKRDAMKNRDGNPFWMGVLWLDSIHAVSCRSYGCNRRLLTALIEEFITEAFRSEYEVDGVLFFGNLVQGRGMLNVINQKLIIKTVKYFHIP